MIQKLKLGTILSALILFFLPWIEIRCSGEAIATQTGFQSIYGGGTVSEGLRAMEAESEASAQSKDEGPGFAILVGIAFAMVLAALALCLVAIFSGVERADTLSSLLPSLALICLLVQLAIGFPASESLEKAIAGFSPESAAGEAESMFTHTVAAGFKVETKATFHVQLLLLAIPGLVFINNFIDKHKHGSNRSHPDTPVREARPEDVYFR